MKNTLTKMKNNLTVEQMKPTIKTAIGNIRKQKTTNKNNRKKKDPKKREQYKEPQGQLQAFQHAHQRGARRRKERARNWKSI